VDVLVVNAGSSSLKLRQIGAGDELLAAADLPAVDRLADGELDAALERLRADSGARAAAVGHRIVHGGAQFSAAVRIDPDVTAALRRLTDLAPLHQPKSLAALDVVTAALPGVPAVACFDTSFHSTMADSVYTYAVPREWQDRYGVRKYGFHGLSHAYCSARVAQILERSGLRVITCHLGAGASLAAVVDGRCVDTTMGFTPLDGLVMATRSGAIDPGLVLWLEEHERLRPREIADALEHRSGLLGLAGSADMRVVERQAAAGDARARLALAVYLHRLVTSIGAMAAAAGGVDALAFTGGVGERAPAIRAAVAERLDHLGIAIDEELNASAGSDLDVSSRSARARTLVITAREDLQIARETRRVLWPAAGPR
jgi:acetate kinase